MASSSRILIIDNGTNYLDHFVELLQDYQVETVHWSHDFRAINDADLIVLSGTSYLPVVGAHTLYKHYLQLMKTCDKPIIGICFGFHLIAKAFAKEVETGFFPHFGHFQTHVVNPHPIFCDDNQFIGHYKHAFRIRSMDDSFRVLARYRDGIAMAEHVHRPIVGIQFHPEDHMEELSTDTYFQNTVAYLLEAYGDADSPGSGGK